MAAPPVVPTPVARSAHRALILLVTAVLMVAALLLAPAQHSEGVPPWGPSLFVAVALCYLAAGVLAWWRRPSNRLGAIMIAGCLALLAATMSFTPTPALVAVGVISSTVILAVMVHLLHAFPSGRLRSRASRWTVLAGYVTAVVLQAPLYLFAPAPPPAHLLGIADRPDLVAVGEVVQTTLGSAVMVVTLVMLGATPPGRRSSAPQGAGTALRLWDDRGAAHSAGAQRDRAADPADCRAAGRRAAGRHRRRPARVLPRSAARRFRSHR